MHLIKTRFVSACVSRVSAHVSAHVSAYVSAHVPAHVSARIRPRIRPYTQEDSVKFAIDAGSRPAGMLIALTLQQEKKLLALQKDPLNHKKPKGGLKGVPTREQVADKKKNMKKRSKAGVIVSTLLELNNLTKCYMLPSSLSKALTLSTANTLSTAPVGDIMCIPQVSDMYPCAYH